MSLSVSQSQATISRHENVKVLHQGTSMRLSNSHHGCLGSQSTIKSNIEKGRQRVMSHENNVSSRAYGRPLIHTQSLTRIFESRPIIEQIPRSKLSNHFFSNSAKKNTPISMLIMAPVQDSTSK